MNNIQSKLPHLRPNIFSYMSGIAAKHQAVNLAQGFPDFACAPELIELLHHYAQKGLNQYAPGPGVPALREQISQYLMRRDQQHYDVDTEITVTCGATEALFCCINAFVGAGDEAIIFEPAFDTYEPTIEFVGGVVKPIRLQAPEFKIDWQKLKDTISEKTKILILNTPHNPSGTVLSQEDLEQLAAILAGTNIIVISDEVYADMVFAPHQHHSASSIPSLRERSVVIGSFGKSFHITGWKVGFCAAPAYLTDELRKIHTLTTFSVHSPSQFALAELMKDTQHIESVAPLYTQKKEYFLSGLKNSPWQFLSSQGSYFVTADYSDISDMDDMDFCHYLAQEHKVAAIPYSAFYKTAPTNQRLVRFCFAKQEQTLDAAIQRLNNISSS